MRKHIQELLDEAQRCNQRRLIVLAIERNVALKYIEEIFENFKNKEKLVFTWKKENLRIGATERLKNAQRHMGATYDLVAIDLHESFVPNDLGKIAGMVRGGGLLFLLTPPFDVWKSQTNYFHESILTPPYKMEEMRHNFIPWVIKKLETMEGIAIYSGKNWVKKGNCDCKPPLAFKEAFHGIDLLSPDQKRVLEEITHLKKIGVVLTADRGRGKSSTLGIAIANLIQSKKVRKVCITAPARENLNEFLKFMRLIFKQSGVDCNITHTCRGRGYEIRIVEPSEEMHGCDLIVADEAAGIPVHILLKYAKAKNVIYSTTTHGYEGTGRAFSVRFLSELRNRRKDIVHLKMHTPIRYAPDDPVEKWLFSTLLLDSEPASIDAPIKKVEYRTYKIEDLLENEAKLREFYGIFVLAHYRNNPNDFGIICDAPNHEIRTLEYDGHVVCAAQIAREGNLGKFAEEMYYGYMPPGNIVSDVVIKHYRDMEFGKLRGIRIVRIATHPKLMNMGLGTEILKNIKNENVDWIGASFGATPQLLRFWGRSGFVPIHVSPRANEKTGEYSVVVLHTNSGAHKKFGAKFVERFLITLGGVHSTMAPQIAAAILSSTPKKGKIKLNEEDWKRIVAYAWGPGNYEVTEDALWKLAKGYFTAKKKLELSTEQERIMIARVLQHRTWKATGEAVNRGEMYVVIELREAVRRLLGGRENDEVSEFQRRFHGENS